MIRRLQYLLLVAVAVLSSTLSAATFPSGRPSTTNNDDSCDVAVLPAATLLLPYFEVDITAPISTAQTTIFTVVNTTRLPQIARLTVWTDLGFPVLWFNVFLTGYDAQAFNMYDILARGVISDGQITNAKPAGSRSAPNNSNPNFIPGSEQSCMQLPTILPSILLQDFQRALTVGTYSLCESSSRVGTAHANAAGYVTIDLVATCSPKGPLDAGYFDELLYDNVLTGDWERISPNPATGNYAGGNPLVHIRAIPEGGAPGTVQATNLPYTFYDRYTPAGNRRIDRRQPLPSTFVSRFIQGGPTAFETELQIWREGVTGAGSSCTVYGLNNMPTVDIVRFDERENPTVFTTLPIGTQPPRGLPSLPAVSRTHTASSNFPPLASSGDVGGFLYLNLSNGGSANYSAAAGRDFVTDSSTVTGPRQSQNWVTVGMYAEGRYSVMFDATMLANGCTRSPAGPGFGANIPPIGPGPNDTP